MEKGTNHKTKLNLRDHNAPPHPKLILFRESLGANIETEARI